MSFVFALGPYPAVAVADSDALFPVHRIYCVGQNYAAHAKEMGSSGRDAPFFFSKPADAVIPVAQGSVGQMPYPTMTQNLHHEIELVVALGSGGSNIAVADAMSHVWGYAVGLDMTRRDLQAEAKKTRSAVEYGKRLRPFCADRSDSSGRNCAAHRRNQFDGQWRAAPAPQTRRHDLERRRNRQ